MLGIIFTRKRLFAAWSDNDLIKWIPVGHSGKNFVFHFGECLTTLQNHFNQIYRAAQWHAFGNGVTPLESLSLALVFPSDDAVIAASEKQVILNWISSLSVDWSDVRSVALNTALSLSLPRHYSDMILLESLDEGLHIQSTIPEIARKIPLLDLSDLGYNDGIEHVYQVISGELKQKNLSLPADALTDLRSEINEYEVGKKLIINFADGFAKVSLDLSLSPSRYYDLLTWKRGKYFEMISNLIDPSQPKCSILFVSDLYDNLVFRDYIKNLASSRISRTTDIRFYSEKKALESIFTYLGSHPSTAISGRRSDLFSEIKSKCTDRKKYRNYLDKYLPMARKLAIPDEQIIWQIRQSINSLQKLSEIGDVVEPSERALSPGLTATTEKGLDMPAPPSQIVFSQTPKKNENIYEKNATITPHHSLNRTSEHPKDEKKAQIDPDLLILDQNLLRNISDFAVYLEKLPDKEFICFKGRLLNDRQIRVFRVLKNSASAESVRHFEKLQEREKSYYKDCSGIHQSPFGDLYFYRPFVEGELLENYVKRTGLHKKFRLKDISALDLELMLELWRTIYRLKFSFEGLTKNNFVVSVNWRLPLKREIEVTLINIDSSDGDKQSMEQKMTEVFQEVFGQNLTTEFLKQFRNH